MSNTARAEAERLLHELQRQAWEANPPPPGSDLEHAAEVRRVIRERIAADPAFVDELRSHFRDASESDKSDAEAFIHAGEYEDPWAYRVVASVTADVERAVAELRKHVPGPVVVGTARTRRVNAVVIAVGPSAAMGHVVLVDGALLPFLTDVALLVARMLPESKEGEGTTGLSLDPEEIQAHLDANDPLVERAADDAMRFITGAYPLEPGDAEGLSSAKGTFANVLYRLLTVFVVGHEYAHLHLGHMEDRPPVAGLEKLPDHWFFELEADGGGLEIALRVAHRYRVDPSLAYLACQLFFFGQQIIDIGEAIRTTGSLDRAVDEVIRVQQLALEQPSLLASALSHPPPGVRRKALRVKVKSSASSPEAFEAVTGAVTDFHSGLNEILAEITSALEHRLVAA